MVLWIKWNDDHGIKAVPDNGTVSFSFIYSLISYLHEARSQRSLCSNTVILTSTLDKCLYQAVLYRLTTPEHKPIPYKSLTDVFSLIVRFTDINKPLPLLRGRHNYHANRSREGTRKRRSTDESFVETLVVADRTMVDAFKSKADLQAYILTLMGVVRPLRKLLNPTGQNKMEQHAFIPPKIKHVAFKRAMIFPSLILGVSAGSTFFRPFCTGL